VETDHRPRMLRFGVFEVDLRAVELRKYGIRIRLQEQPFQILALLLGRLGEVVTREELRQKLWSADTFVDSDRNLNKAINKLRAALGDSAESPRFIETLHRRGYRFIAPISEHLDNCTGNSTQHRLVEHGAARRPSAVDSAPVSFATRVASAAASPLVYAICATALILIFLGAAFHFRVAGGGSVRVSPRRSVAVLGFKNLSNRPDQAWLSTALADWLTTELSAGEQLRTVPTENVARMKIELGLPDVDKVTTASLARIGKNLGTDLVVVGSYAIVGDGSNGRIRLDLRLENTKNGETLRALSETGTESRLFDLVSGAGAALRASLGVQPVTTAVGLGLPSNPEAARLYSEGLAKLRVFDALSARDLLQKAVNRDRDYALSYSALASAWAALGYDEKATAQAKKAYDLSGSLSRAERLLVEGRYQEMSQHWQKAIDIYRALFEFYPDNVDYGLALVEAQVSAGQGSSALETVEALHKLPSPLGDDPRIELAEARAAESLGDFKQDLASSELAAEKAQLIDASLLLAQARAAKAWALENQGRFDEAAAAANAAGEIYATAGDRRGMARAATVAGIALENRGDNLGAKKMYEQALVIFRQIGNKLGVANGLDNLGDVLLALGDLAGARRAYEGALATNREIGNLDGVALTTGALAPVLLALGDYAGAKRTSQESVEICRSIGDRAKAAIGLANLGRVFQAEGNLDAAGNFERQALQTYQEIGDRQSAARIQLALAELLTEEGNGSAAAAAARAAAQEFEREHVSRDLSLANAVIARAFLAQRQVAEARQAAADATAMLGKYYDRSVEFFVDLTAARVRAASGQPPEQIEAANLARSVLTEATQHGFVNYELEARLALGEIQMSAGNRAGGRAHFEAVEKEAAVKGFGLLAQKAAEDLTMLPAAGGK
jgi:eukaryotic-like serine/threonine-protein kinase